jgi:hypothetical protein
MEVLPGFTAFYIPKSFYKYNGVKLYSKWLFVKLRKLLLGLSRKDMVYPSLGGYAKTSAIVPY